MPEIMTLMDAYKEIAGTGLAERLNERDVLTLAEKLMTSVNEAFAIGRLDKEVVG